MGRTIKEIPEGMDSAAAREAFLAAMAEFALEKETSEEGHTRWTHHGTSDAYPLFVDFGTSKSGRLMLRGYLLDDDGNPLTLDGDDGVSHHAKSVARDEFDGIFESLSAKVSHPEAEPTTEAAAVASPAAETPAMSPMPQTMSPVPVQVASQQVPQAVATGGVGTMWSTSQQGAPSPAAPVYGYGAQPQQGSSDRPPVAPGWAVESVPDQHMLFIFLSVVLLTALLSPLMRAAAQDAEMFVIMLTFGLFVIPFLCWPAIPALVLSIQYRKAYLAGNGMLAAMKRKSARTWLIVSAIWCALQWLISLVACS